MFNALPTHSMNQLLSRFSSLEYILLGDLRDLLHDEPSDHITCKWLTAVLDALLDTLPKEFALQEEGGYMADVLEIVPNWSGHVETLERERDALFVKLAELRERVSEYIPFEKFAKELQRDLHAWMNRLIAFHRHEQRLVQTAYNLDIGIGD